MPAIPIIYSALSSRQPRRVYSGIDFKPQFEGRALPQPLQDLPIDQALSSRQPSGPETALHSLTDDAPFASSRQVVDRSPLSRFLRKRTSLPSIPPYLAPLSPLDTLQTISWHRRDVPPEDSVAARDFVLVPLPAVYKGLTAGPSPGVMVGITLGSVVGFLLLVWVVWWVATFNFVGGGMIQGQDTEIVVERHHSSRHHSSHGEKRRRRRRKTRRSSVSSQSSRSPAPRPASQPPVAPPPRRTERIIVDETVRRTVSSSRPPPREREREVVRETVVVEETEEIRVPGDDEVEVVEEHSEIIEEERPRRKKSTKSGYRTVDPNAYAGGNYEQRDVYEKRSSRR